MVYRILPFLMAVGLSAQTQFLPLKEVRPGMKGVGKTVFSGVKVEDFQVEILGVLENVWPKQSLILARLAGGPLAKTGVMQGMSGSPVYIGGKLVGAVGMSFPFSTEPIAGIRPIEDMLRIATEPPSQGPVRAQVSLLDQDLTRVFPEPANVLTGGTKLVDIATPITFGGFTRNTMAAFAPKLRALGLEPQQGAASGGRPSSVLGRPSDLQPGSMISIQLLSGDLSVGADGTVTYIDGQKLYAFGHRLLAVGSTDLPFARSMVLALLPNLQSSFKISSAREWMGAITDDRSTAVFGRLGQRAAMVPISISVTRQPGKKTDYRIEMVNDRFLAPLLVQMSVFSALDATERSMGASSFLLKGEMQFKGAAAPLKIDNMYAGDLNTAMQVSMGVAVPLAYVMQSGFETLQLKNISLNLESFDAKRQLQIDQVWPSQREVRPGETVDLHVVLAGENGKEISRKVSYTIPAGAPLGPLYFTVADGNYTNLTEYRQLLTNAPKSIAQMVSFLNHLRANTHAYVRVWRAKPAYDIGGESFPDPPPSAALILSKSEPAVGGTVPSQNSKLAELEISAGEMVITGSKTVQVEVKE